MSPAGALLVTHLQETFTTKYNVLFTLWTQTLLFNDVKVTVNFSWFLHSAYLVKQASVLLHILLTQPRRPLAFFLQLANFPLFNKQEDGNADNQISIYSCTLDEM